MRILIDKSEYKLSILAGSRIIKEYPVVFGTNPIDDKLMEDDRSTPEGSFKIHDFIHINLGLNLFGLTTQPKIHGKSTIKLNLKTEFQMTLLLVEKLESMKFQMVSLV